MVNTFLPWPDHDRSAQELDNKRLGKQRVEALQILRANLGLTKGWKNHPAAVMWRGHEGYLYLYTNAMCMEWRKRGYEDNVQSQLQDIHAEFDLQGWDPPWWWGNDVIHKSHRSNLKRKDPVHYRYKVKADLPYQWPMPDLTFRTVQKKEAKRGGKHDNSDKP